MHEFLDIVLSRTQLPLSDPLLPADLANHYLANVHGNERPDRPPPPRASTLGAEPEAATCPMLHPALVLSERGRDQTEPPTPPLDDSALGTHEVHCIGTCW